MALVDPLSRDVHRFYDANPFPGERTPDQDGLILLRQLRRRRPAPRRILDAGCGTGNTAVSVARLLPDAHVLGVDFCTRSLEIARGFARREGVENIRFELRDILAEVPGASSFDVVLCLGVLHHTADMRRALRRLARELTEGGDLYLWVYGRHGRYRHAQNQALLSLLIGEGASLEEATDLAREFALRTDDGAPLRDLADGGALGADWQRRVENDPWIADQFLHVHETSMTMPDLLDLAEVAGLELSGWLGTGTRPEARLGSEELLARFERLGPRERLVALDLLLKPARYFVRLRRKRPS